MANVILKYRGDIAEKINITKELAMGDDIADILDYIKKLYGKDVYKKAKSMLITINGESIINREVYKTKLSDGDEISFFPLSAGG